MSDKGNGRMASEGKQRMAEKQVTDLLVSPDGLECVWTKPETLTDTRMHYCPGCGHGVVHKVLMEVV